MAGYFFYAQRCGIDVPGWHGPCHLDDGRMPDGRRIDLSGGWHDAGDYNKYNGYTPLAVFALARTANSPAARTIPWPSGQPLLLEEAVWGARWLQKCQDAATKKILGRIFSGFAFWGIPEAETDNVPGNEDDRPVDVLKWNENEMTVAAWAGALISKVIPKEKQRVLSWVSGCLDWMLGINPFGICMMAEAGSFHIPLYHHRYDRIQNGKAGRIPGAICNGITRLEINLDLPYLDLESNWWRTNEPWLPHNSYFLLALSELQLGGRVFRERQPKAGGKTSLSPGKRNLSGSR